MPHTTERDTVTFANGSHYSSVITLSGSAYDSLRVISMPAAFTGNQLAVEAAASPTDPFYPLYTDGGVEVVIPVAQGRVIVLDTFAVALIMAGTIRFRSQTTGVNADQAAARTLTIDLRG